MYLDIALESKVGPEQFRDLGLLAEGYGFRAIWAQNYSRAPDPFMTAVPLALASRQIRVGVAVVCHQEMHPLKIANAVLTLNEYSGGHASVVVTAGGEWPGVIKTPSKQVAATREALEIIKAAVGDQVVNYAGEHYNAQAFSSRWTNHTPPAIYAGAHGPKMLRMAAGIADGIMLSDVQPAMFDRVLANVRAAFASQGCGAGFPLSNFLAWHVKEDRERSFREARRELIIRAWLDYDWISPFLSPDDTQWVLAHQWDFLKAFRDRTGDLESVPAHISDALVEGLTCSGDASDIDRHIERLKAYEAAGFTEIVLGLQDDPADAIHMIGERVMPAFERAGPADARVAATQSQDY
jgi:alkanesulfonate monooxygenase SsuD/methylene tetrahydromethanopterin reductase-like flavin-dependent oxidoreductase (luciferase family)